MGSGREAGLATSSVLWPLCHITAQISAHLVAELETEVIFFQQFIGSFFPPRSIDFSRASAGDGAEERSLFGCEPRASGCCA